ncbi:unnamed protein product [Linum tenue]|uniref:Uncharacterized protein n=1 Tax=Linum tenue TaxID=586396 RepID=A0AAV0NFA2_9ROSI|nr:unnamed protein product [Linum tenue]
MVDWGSGIWKALIQLCSESSFGAYIRGKTLSLHASSKQNITGIPTYSTQGWGTALASYGEVSLARRNS